MWDRISSWKSTAGGAGISAALFAAVGTFGCQFPTDWKAWAVLSAPAIIGAFMKGKAK